MKPSCEVIAKYVLPAFRAMVAKELMTRYNMPQSEVADRLGITQAAVSQYLNSKRGALMTSELEKIPAVTQAIPQVVKTMTEQPDPDEIFTEFCKLCTAVRSDKSFWIKIEEITKSK